jgi:hypothetical protein
MAKTGDRDDDDLHWAEVQYDLHEFIKQYETSLPVMIRVVDGYDGTDDQHCVSTGEASKAFGSCVYQCRTIHIAVNV